MNASDKSMLDYAIDYAREHNWPVFPCDPATKKPLTKNGFKDATTDPEQISAWWHRDPDAMIGLPTGKKTGIVVLDVDVDPEKGIDGRAALTGLDMPSTMIVQTPRGGFHYYFLWPEGVEIRNSASDLGKGLDVRGEGGYVIGAPSINRAGKPYSISNGSEIMPTPAWFVERVRVKERPPPPEFSRANVSDDRMQKYGDVALARTCDDCAFAPVSQRHIIFLREATSMFGLVKGGYSTVDRVRDHLRDAGLAAGRTAREVDNDLRDALAYATPRGPKDRDDRKANRHWNDGDTWREQPEEEPQEIEPFPTISAATLFGKQKPREFLDVSEIFPARNVALFSGEGAIGKSLFILQLALACTTNTKWLGIEVKQGPVLYFSAEDDRDEITNRLNEICDAEDIYLGEATGLEIMDMVGEETVLAIENRSTGGIKPTPVLVRLVATIEAMHPVLVILDNLADIFGGNENNRVHAKQFITLLRNVCIKQDTIVIILGHPSNTGMATGTGMSGSTAWNNSVRCRPYLHKPDGADSDDRTRIFEVMKANYSAQGTIRWEVEWKKGRFVRSQPKSAFDRITTDDVEKVKDRFAAQRHRVNEQSGDWGGYAVADILGWDVGRGIGAKQRTVEQNRNRDNIRTYLAVWVRSSAIFVIDGFTTKREKTQFYSNRPGLSVV